MTKESRSHIKPPPSIKCRIVGVDPGQTGAIAYVERDGDGKPIDIRVMDCITKPNGLLDSNKMSELMRIWPVAYLAVFEQQIQQRGKGIKTMFTNYGILMAVVERSAHRIEEVHSRTWKSRLRLDDDKAKSIAMVHDLFPEWAHLLQRPRALKNSGDSGDRAEAILIAHDAYERVWIPEDLGRLGALL